jgi:glycerol-3-phosphate dehydrogenase
MHRLLPDLRHDAAIGAIKYWDAAVDDARLVLTALRTAVGYGALAASRTQVLDLIKEGGRVVGARVEDLETGTAHEIRAEAVIAATGVWTEETEALSGSTGGLRVLASKGIHIVVPRTKISGTTGLILQTEKSVLFIIPWSRYWIIGTTDTPWDGGFQHPSVNSSDIDYVLEKANSVLAVPLTREDIIGTWAGLRPLLKPGTKAGTSSAKISREHTTASPIPGLTVIAGGKLTTYRVMARDAVDFALGPRAAENPSVTHKTPLAGAVGVDATRNKAKAWAKRYGWSHAMVEHLLHRYGSMLADLIDAIELDPDLARPLQHAPAYLRAEIAYAATHEGIVHLEDVLLHRTRLTYEVPDRGVAALEEIIEIIAPIMRWDADRIAVELRDYRDRVAAELAAEAQPDDISAEKARLSSPGLRPMRPTD